MRYVCTPGASLSYSIMSSPKKTTQTGRLPRAIITIFVLFLVAFPKGGFKIQEIPITWGYIALFIVSIFLLIRLMALPLEKSIHFKAMLLWAATIPFSAVFIASFITNGVENLGFATSLIVSFAGLPFIFLILFTSFIAKTNLIFIFSRLQIAVRFITTYGIFLFFYKFTFGEFIEIPFLVVNSGDTGLLDSKHIDRGGIFKLISTYNNGNIYGICLLMLLPIYDLIEKNRLFRLTAKGSLLLTLSRTVWIGLIAYELVKHIYIRKNLNQTANANPTLKNNSINSRKGNRALSLFSFSTGLLLIALAAIYLSTLITYNGSFFVDAQLGGRIVQFTSLSEIHFFPKDKFSSISEIVYLSALKELGLLGLLTLLIALLAPIFTGLCHRKRNLPVNRAAVSGLCIYLLLCFSDGAILFIPTMAFYWFLSTLIASDNLGWL